jgi:hypothetical protein
MKFMVLLLVVLAVVTAAAAVTQGARGRGHTQPADRDQMATLPRDRASRPNAALKGYQFPNPATTGVPKGWKPRRTRATDLTVTRRGTVVQDVRFTNGASILVKADNVTIRRVDMQGGSITNQFGPAPASCGHHLLVEDTTFEQIPGQFDASDGPVIGEGSYTARRIEVDGRGEGPRLSDCGPVTVEDSFISIHGADAGTRACDAVHSDGFQAYYGRGGTFTNNTIIFETKCGSSPYFVGYGANTTSKAPINTGTYNIDRMLIGGISGYPFRQQVPGSISGLRIVNKSWIYGPIDNRCSVLSPWDAKIVKVDSRYRITRVVRKQRCNTRF